MYRSHSLPAIAVLPRPPINRSPVPGLTSLYHRADRGSWGSPAYPGNCSGYLIRDLLRFFRPRNVLDPMTGSGTCAEVCRELQVDCVSFDIRDGKDACDPSNYAEQGVFDFIWIHPPYWRQKRYSDDPRDLSTAESLADFLERYQMLIRNLAKCLAPNGKLAVLMGDYEDREHGYAPLTYYTKQFAFDAGLRQACTDIIRFQHGNTSSRRVYRSSFIPGLHDVCAVFQKA